MYWETDSPTQLQNRRIAFEDEDGYWSLVLRGGVHELFTIRSQCALSPGSKNSRNRFSSIFR